MEYRTEIDGATFGNPTLELPKSVPIQEEKGLTSPSDSDVEQGTTKPEEPTRKIRGVAWFILVFAILSSTFLFSLDNTIVSVVQPAVVKQFDSLTEIAWVSVGFVLGGVTTNLFWGRLYALFDGKILYIIGVILFEGGSALCGAAPNMNALIIGRTLCGVGGSGMYIGVLTLLSVLTTTQERPLYIGISGLTWGAGTALGPIVGGAFTDSGATWRWAFYINLCIGGVFAPVYLWLLPASKPRPNDSTRALWASVDFVGAILSIGFFASFIMAISFGGNLYPWNSGQVISLFVVAGVLFICFAIQQVKHLFTSDRMFPVHFVLSKDLVILFASIASGTTLVFLPIYFMPLFFEFILHDTALNAGVRSLSFIIPLIISSLVNGAVMSKNGIYWPWYTAGSALCVIGSAVLYTGDMYTSYSRIAGASALVGIGAGMFTQATFAVAQAKVLPEEVPLATGFIACGQMTGATISLSISNTLFTNDAIRGILGVVPDATSEAVAASVAGANDAFFQALSGEKLAEVYAIITTSINRSYILAMTAGALVFVISLFMKKEKLFLAAVAAA